MSPLLSPRLVIGKNIPLLLYGTAWKEDKTAALTESALKHGFTGVDTANHPRSYNEPLTGDGVAAALKSGVRREDLFIQSKFTPIWVHDPEQIPYNPDQDIEGQVRESIQQTFNHLKLDYLDAFLLHAPFQKDEDSLVAWKVFETFVPHKIRHLGVSNIALPQLQQIYEAASIKPVIVQNRFFKDTSFDLDVRAFCKDHGIVYQAFGALRHNPDITNSKVVSSVAEKLGVEKAVAFYILILCLGDIQLLDGTTKSERMVNDLKAIANVAGNEDLLDELQPSVVEFKKILVELSGRKARFCSVQ